MNRCLIALVGLVVVAIPAIVEASPRIHSAKATPIYRRNVSVTSTTTRTFTTANLQAWSGIGCDVADTYLVVRRPNGSMYTNDDCNSNTRASCVSAPGLPVNTPCLV